MAKRALVGLLVVVSLAIVGVFWVGRSPGGAPAASPAVLVGAGDIASCTTDGARETAAILASIGGTIFTAGDNAYSHGTVQQYRACYDPTWGAFKDRTRPAPGNHEYDTSAGAPYYSYFGSGAGEPGQGWYDFTLGTWQIYVLNSNCADIGGCGADDPQGRWLASELAAHSTRCSLAIWHHPLFSSGQHGNQKIVRPFWDVLYAAGADVVINGHDHEYERFAPQDPAGQADSANGIREFVVGTGGKSLYRYRVIRPNSEVRDNHTYGVLKLTLWPDHYDWQFIPVAAAPAPSLETPDENAGSSAGPKASEPSSAPASAASTAPSGDSVGSFTDSGTGLCH